MDQNGLADISKAAMLEWYNANQRHYNDALNALLGSAISYYTYVLLDSRVISNKTVNFGAFVKAIFFVGQEADTRVIDYTDETKRFLKKLKKGKVSPDSLDENKKLLKNFSGNPKKIKRILEVWKEGKAPMSLKIRPSAQIQESLIKKALLIETLGIDHLCNHIKGSYSSCAHEWNAVEKKDMGVFLLKEAFVSFIEHGADEMPYDIEGFQPFIDTGIQLLEKTIVLREKSTSLEEKFSLCSLADELSYSDVQDGIHQLVIDD